MTTPGNGPGAPTGPASATPLPSGLPATARTAGKLHLLLAALVLGLPAGLAAWVYLRSERRCVPSPRALVPVVTPARLTRGSELAATACAPCHGTDLAGGRAFASPIGLAWASNLTPDASGLGGWSPGQIEEALRRGTSRDGRPLHPPMPIYSGLADDDTESLLVFLASIAPIASPSRAPEPSLGGRIALARDEGLTARPPVRGGVVAPPRGETPAWGRYLSESVLACADCHSARKGGVPIPGKLWAGGLRIDTPGLAPILAANVTPHPVEGIGLWTSSDFARALQSGVTPSGRALHPAMPRYPLSDEDARAIFLHLRSVSPVADHVLSPAAVRGGELYATTCVGCHGPDGSGPRADLRPLASSGDLARIKAWVKDPQAAKPGSLMPQLGITDEADLDSIARYIVEVARRR